MQKGGRGGLSEDVEHGCFERRSGLEVREMRSYDPGQADGLGQRGDKERDESDRQEDSFESGEVPGEVQGDVASEELPRAGCQICPVADLWK